MVLVIMPCLVHRFSALHSHFPKCQHLFAEFGKTIRKRENRGENEEIGKEGRERHADLLYLRGRPLYRRH